MKCGICRKDGLKFLFSKPDKYGNPYSLYKCLSCKVIQIHPIPSPQELEKYYSNEYFTNRTDRGYDNYYSEELKKELTRVWNLNLQDLGVLSKIQSFSGKSLDIGCAVGYFVGYMKNHGWDSMGIDIAKEPVEYGREKLGFNLLLGDFLEWDKKIENKFHLISLWATIEHLTNPIAILNKVYNHLEDNGIFVISTCRYGWLAKLRKENWRFFNVPEHIFYFGKENFIKIMDTIGFKLYGSVFYGSGLTAKKNASLFYKYSKVILDKLVKILSQGDMMALSFEKKNHYKE